MLARKMPSKFGKKRLSRSRAPSYESPRDTKWYTAIHTLIHTLFTACYQLNSVTPEAYIPSRVMYIVVACGRPKPMAGILRHSK